MDGTLLSSDKKLAERTALAKADQRGIHVVLATGRIFQGLEAYMEILPFVRYNITVNGSYVWDAKANTALYSATIPIERGMEIISYIEKYETMNDCYIDGQGWIDQRYLDNMHDYIADEEVVRLVCYTRSGWKME
jgi:hydroxymethylpyrimidine pyrophosphatase-like HAD family hydrolase